MAAVQPRPPLQAQVATGVQKQGELTYGAASNASTDTNDILSSENWKYVECCNCRADVLVQEVGQEAGRKLRDDFWLTECGHIGCTRCLEGQAGCPKCGKEVKEKLPVHLATTDSSVGAYFRSTEAMTKEIHRTLNFQTENLRDQVSYYKKLSQKQSTVLKNIKTELINLRETKRNYEALVRENNALKTQLGSIQQDVQVHQQQRYPAEQGPPHIYQAPQVRSGRTTPVLQAGGMFNQHVARTVQSTPQYQQQLPDQNWQAAAPAAAATSRVQQNHRQNQQRHPAMRPLSIQNTPLPQNADYGENDPVRPNVHLGVKRKFDEAMPEANAHSRRMSEHQLRGMGSVSSADHQLQGETVDEEDGQNMDRRIAPLERFRNPLNPSPATGRRPSSAQGGRDTTSGTAPVTSHRNRLQQQAFQQHPPLTVIKEMHSQGQQCTGNDGYAHQSDEAMYDYAQASEMSQQEMEEVLGAYDADLEAELAMPSIPVTSHHRPNPRHTTRIHEQGNNSNRTGFVPASEYAPAGSSMAPSTSHQVSKYHKPSTFQALRPASRVDGQHSASNSGRNMPTRVTNTNFLPHNGASNVTGGIATTHSRPFNPSNNNQSSSGMKRPASAAGQNGRHLATPLSVPSGGQLAPDRGRDLEATGPPSSKSGMMEHLGIPKIAAQANASASGVVRSPGRNRGNAQGGRSAPATVRRENNPSNGNVQQAGRGKIFMYQRE